MTMRSLLLAVLCLLCAAAPASADLFANPSRLPNGDPKAHPYFSGGEPSIAFDPSGDGHVYVTAPQRIPTAAGGGQLTGDPTTGIGFWASSDHGASFGNAIATGAGNGGGDTDVEVLQDHSVLAADLEAIATDICTSHDFGKTFQDCNGGIANNQQGPENDREWLTRGAKPGEVYLTYHDFVGGFPIIEKSTDGGQHFTPCGTIIDPNGPAAQNYTPAGGTLVSKPIVAPDGTIYVEFTTPDQTASPVGATLNHLYMGVAKGGCDTTTVFTDHLIYEKAGASLGSIFQQTARDGGGQLYVLAAGKTQPGEANSGLWMFTSTDGGASWSAPKQVNPPAVKGNVFPTIAGGQAKGEALLGWFGTTTSGDPNNGTNQWDYYAAATYDGGGTFATSKVTNSPIHYGDICTQGVFCGLVPGQPGNRNLADFASAAIDPADGCGIFAIPGDPYNRPDQANGADNGGSSAYVSRQTDRSACFTAANAGKPAAAVATVTGAGNGCLDRIAPTSTFAKKVSVARHRRGVTLTGRSRDRGCGPNGVGKVNRVRVAIARKTGKLCRFAKANGSFGKKVSCLRTSYLSAKGTSRFRFTYRHHLPKGKYLAWARGIDTAGNIERKARLSNAKHFTVR